MAKDAHSAKDYAILRSKDPALFAKQVSEEQIDNSDVLLENMDENGITHASSKPRREKMRRINSLPILPNGILPDSSLSTVLRWRWMPSVQEN